MNINIFLSVIIIFIGIYGIVSKKDIILKLLSLGIFQSAIVILFVVIAYRGVSPVYMPEIAVYSDPLIHSFLLTVIVIGFANLALMLVFVMIIVNKYKTYNFDEIENIMNKK
ncbi:MAG TPA: cation:proton antiporter subunit C [Tepiditoga sp.]|nr:cation:proton antiporter subunit C [Tepiditoga sp.]